MKNFCIKKTIRPVTYLFLVIVPCSFFFLCNCSGDGQDQAKEDETVKQKIGREMAEGIKRPLDKAQAVKELEEQRTAELDRQVD